MSGYPKNGQGRVIATQALDFTSVSASTTAFTSQTYLVRLAANAPVHYHVYGGSGSSSTATSADPLLPAQVFEIIGVAPGQRVSAIKASGGNITSADGRMTITELS
jgi:hypothetical protein